MHRKWVPGSLVQQPEAQHPLLPDGGKLIDGVGVPAQAVDGLVCFGAGQDDVAIGTPHHHLIVAVITCTHTENSTNANSLVLQAIIQISCSSCLQLFR